MELNAKILIVLNEQILLFVESERQRPTRATRRKEFEEFERMRKYFSSGREVSQRYENAYNLRKYRMKLEQQEYQNKVSSHYSRSKVPDQQSASSSHITYGEFNYQDFRAAGQLHEFFRPFADFCNDT